MIKGRDAVSEGRSLRVQTSNRLLDSPYLHQLASAPVKEAMLRGSETLLLVDDEPTLRRAAAEFLSLRGCTVLEAQDGADALRSLVRVVANRRVITDVVMPNMSGGALANQILRMRADMKLLFVSGYAGRTLLDPRVFDRERNFLQKPYTSSKLGKSPRCSSVQTSFAIAAAV